jgi:hypothetical protein
MLTRSASTKGGKNESTNLGHGGGNRMTMHLLRAAVAIVAAAALAVVA